jgi:mono/diheme cytochrome c family protein
MVAVPKYCSTVVISMTSRFSAAALLALVSGTGSANADLLRGKQLSVELCSQCHAVIPGKLSPNPKAPTFARSAADPSITRYSLRAFLRTPHWTMPNLIVRPEDMDDIVDYLLSLAPKR